MDTQVNNSWPVSKALSIFVVATFLVLGISITLLLALRIGQAMDESQQTHVSSRIQSLSSDIDLYLKDRQQVLADHARFPILIQTLMQPEVNRGVIADFMAGLKFLGESHQEVLLDFKGRTLHASQGAPTFDYTTSPWLNALMNGNQKHYTGISHHNGTYYWRLAQPLFYNNLPEGVIVTEIPVTQLIQRLQQSEQLAGLNMTLTWHNETITHIGNPITGAAIEVTSSAPGIGFKFTVDDNVATQARNHLLRDTTLLILAITLVMVWLAIQLGKRWFISPIEHLNQLADSLSKGNQFEKASTNLAIKELALLADGLNHMANHIRIRERALLKSHDEMAQLNEYLKTSQAQLVQSEKMASLGTMAAGVAHEINNPIGFVKNNISVMSEYMNVVLPLLRDYHALAISQKEKCPILLKSINKKLGKEDLNYLLEDITTLLDDTADGTERVKEIVAGLKTFARIDESEQKLFDLNESIETTLRVVWNELKYKCTVHKNLVELPKIYGNPGKINQVIMNLLVNAAQAIETKGDITIETMQVVDEVVLRISDTGEGIAADKIDKIFTPFYTSKEIGKGTGLGLSVSHGIIKEHRGSIEVTSMQGKGSTFCINLPSSAPHELTLTPLDQDLQDQAPQDMEKNYELA